MSIPVRGTLPEGVLAGGGTRPAADGPVAAEAAVGTSWPAPVPTAKSAEAFKNVRRFTSASSSAIAVSFRRAAFQQPRIVLLLPTDVERAVAPSSRPGTGPADPQRQAAAGAGRAAAA